MKKLKAFVTVVLAVIIATSVNFGVKYYIYNFKTTELTQIYSDDGKHTVVISQIGLPKGLFASHKVRVELKDSNGEVLHKFDSEIHNDGKTLGYLNWDIEWSDEAVTINLKGEDQPPETYTIGLR